MESLVKPKSRVNNGAGQSRRPAITEMLADVPLVSANTMDKRLNLNINNYLNINNLRDFNVESGIVKRPGRGRTRVNRSDKIAKAKLEFNRLFKELESVAHIACPEHVVEIHALGEKIQGAKKELTTSTRPKWENRKGLDLDLSPPEFIAKYYAAEMAAGTLHRGLIGQEDPPLAVKLPSWLRSHPMPEGIDIPTLPEWNTRQLAKVGEIPSAGRRYVPTPQASLFAAAQYRGLKNKPGM